MVELTLLQYEHRLGKEKGRRCDFQRPFKIMAPQVGLELVRPIFASQPFTAKWTLMLHCVGNDIHADLVCHDAVLGPERRVVDPLPGRRRGQLS